MQSLRRLVRVLVVICACTLMFVSNILPASAVTSKPSEGEANLTKIELKSQEAAQSKPYSLEKTQSEANKGINEVQGDADKEKMLRPDNTNATSFEDKVKDAIDSITDKDNK